jgi:hypothetical protein
MRNVDCATDPLLCGHPKGSELVWVASDKKATKNARKSIHNQTELHNTCGIPQLRAHFHTD